MQCIHLSQLIPGVGHISLSSLTLLQPKLGENPHQHHDGHHSTDNIHNHVGSIAVWFLVDVCYGCRWSAGVCPHWRIVVGAGSLVQTVDFELAAEAVETGATAEQVDTSIAVEGRVPLAHDIIVTPATVTSSWKCFVIIWCGCYQCGLWHHSGYCCQVAGRNLGQSLTWWPRVQSTQRGQTQKKGQWEAYQEWVHGDGHLEIFPTFFDGSVLMCNC